jgi:NAD(P)H-hydrate repair Nnr-like enzyme with NAD(P)H-hydrate epimerase domain
MSSYFIDTGFSVLFLGADGIICKGESINIKELSSFIKKISNKFTFSTGAGNNLRDAFLALRYAKSIGKDVNVLFLGNEFEIHETV